MPLIKDSAIWSIVSIHVMPDLRGSVTLANGSERITYDVMFAGMGNCMADAYELLANQPEFFDYALDRSDIADEFPGSGDAQIIVSGKTLEEHKAAAKDRITRSRNMAEVSGFIAFGKEFDSDVVAVQRISLAVQAAQAVGETYSIEWTCKDNSTIILDFWQMQAIPAVMAQSANELHVKARLLKAQIDSATTFEGVDAIVWDDDLTG